MSPEIMLSYFTAEAIETLIKIHYPFRQVRCRLLTNSLRDVYLVEADGKRYVFYCYRFGWRTRPQIQYEWALIAHIGTKDTVLKVPQPLLTSDPRNGWIVPIAAPEGERFGVLATYAEGVSLRVRISTEIVHQYGQAVAKFHIIADKIELPDLPVTIRPSNDPFVLLANARTHLRLALDRHPTIMQELEPIFDHVLTLLHPLIPTGSAYGLVHGDVMRHNALVAEDGTLTLLDFDYCGVGWRVYDIANMFFSLRGKPNDTAYQAAFLEGYSLHRPLSGEEIALLPLFEVVRILFDAGLMAELAPVWGYQHCWKEVEGSLVQLREALARL
jgi:Ser/Thr protein kinase RdoA (MazF antagonist)